MPNFAISIDTTLLEEYREAARALFPDEHTAHKQPDTAAWHSCLAFAQALGIGTSYHALGLDQKDRQGSSGFLSSFRNNLELLIQKTWVEKADEDRKERMLDRIPDLIALINKKAYTKALTEFEAILKELAWLLFGAQSGKEDFLDYVHRIDEQLGLFWWYAGQLEQVLSAVKDEQRAKRLLFLGICYLTNF